MYLDYRANSISIAFKCDIGDKKRSKKDSKVFCG